MFQAKHYESASRGADHCRDNGFLHVSKHFLRVRESCGIIRSFTEKHVAMIGAALQAETNYFREEAGDVWDEFGSGK